jgi:hypothetical protein
MTQLANANLLDETVSNSSNLKNSLKTERIQKTAQRAKNPQPIKEDVEKVIEDEQEENESYETPNFEKQSFAKRLEQKEEEKDDKILGMKPLLFYGIVGITLAVGGYLLYKKFFNNKKTISIGGGAGTNGGATISSSINPNVSATNPKV